MFKMAWKVVSWAVIKDYQLNLQVQVSSFHNLLLCFSRWVKWLYLYSHLTHREKHNNKYDLCFKKTSKKVINKSSPCTRDELDVLPSAFLHVHVHVHVSWLTQYSMYEGRKMEITVEIALCCSQPCRRPPSRKNKMATNKTQSYSFYSPLGLPAGKCSRHSAL